MTETHSEMERDILADHENRISFLENSLPGSAMTPKEEESQEDIKQPDKPWSKSQWDIVQQLIGEIKHIHKEVHKLLGEGRYKEGWRGE